MIIVILGSVQECRASSHHRQRLSDSRNLCTLRLGRFPRSPQLDRTRCLWRNQLLHAVLFSPAQDVCPQRKLRLSEHWRSSSLRYWAVTLVCGDVRLQATFAGGTLILAAAGLAYSEWKPDVVGIKGHHKLDPELSPTDEQTDRAASVNAHLAKVGCRTAGRRVRAWRWAGST